jgi:hypothetical protein
VVDWSGAAANAATKIWLAEASDGTLLRVECGRGREALADFLIREAEQSDDGVVGFDFAFSFLAWFLEERVFASAPELWDLAARDSE